MTNITSHSSFSAQTGNTNPFAFLTMTTLFFIWILVANQFLFPFSFILPIGAYIYISWYALPGARLTPVMQEALETP